MSLPPIAPDAPTTPIDALFDALARGDVAAARACCTPDVAIWHSFDGVVQDLETACRGWEWFVAAFPERSFVDVRRAPTPDGYVQQHLMVATRPGAGRLAWPICIVVTVRDGRIARLEEYMDRAGGFPAADDRVATPGLPPRG
jgi:ketosteroid isomerase-like protein